MSSRRDAPSVDRALAVALRGVTSIESLGDAFPAGVLMTDAAGRCVYANPRVQELLGLNAEELARNGFVPAIEPDDRPTVERELAAAVADAADWQSEFRCRRRDGSVVTVALRAVPLRGPEGDVTGHIAAVEDISLRSRLYAKLTALIETSRILLDTPRLGAVLPAVVQVARHLIAADGYALWRLHEDTDWRVVVSNGVSETFAAAVVPSQGAQVPQAPLGVSDVSATASLANRQLAYAAEGVRALLAVPLHIRGSWSGSLVFYYRTVQHFDHIRMETAAALGNLCAVAIATAELYEEQLAHREHLERAHRQSTFLARAGVILGGSLDYEATLKAVAELAVPHMADWCAVDMARRRGRGRAPRGGRGTPTRRGGRPRRSITRRYPPRGRRRRPADPAHGGHRSACGRSPTRCSRRAWRTTRSACAGGARARGAAGRGMAVPIVVHGRALGVLSFGSSESGRGCSRPATRPRAEEIGAGRAGVAIDNARALRARAARARARRQPRQGRVPGHAVARAAHAAQRHPRLDADAAHGGNVDPDRRRTRSTRSSATPRAGAARRGPARRVADHHRQAAARRAAGRHRRVVSRPRSTVGPRAQAKGLRVQTVSRTAGRSRATPTGCSR